MVKSLVASAGDKLDAFRTKLIIYIVIGIVIIVIISLLLDGIRKIIRGLDIAALGALFLWLGIKSKNVILINVASRYLLAAGGTLFIIGLLVFLILRLIRRKHDDRVYMKRQRKLEKQQTIIKEHEDRGTPS